MLWHPVLVQAVAFAIALNSEVPLALFEVTRADIRFDILARTVGTFA